MTMSSAHPWSILRYEKTGTEPILSSPGESVIWERGQGSYDAPNSSLDGAYWDSAASHQDDCDDSDVSETATYIRAWAHKPSSGSPEAYRHDCYAATNDLPDIDEMSEVEFRVTTPDDLDDGLVIIFGNTVWDETLSNDPQDIVFRATKREDGDWDVYQDDVWDVTITPSDNVIKVQVMQDNDNLKTTAERQFEIRIHDLTVDGGTYFMTHTSDGKNYRVTLKSYS